MNPTELIEWHPVSEPVPGKTYVIIWAKEGVSAPYTNWDSKPVYLSSDVYDFWTQIQGPSNVKEEKLVFETQPVFHVDPDVMEMANSLCQGGLVSEHYGCASGDVVAADAVVSMAKLIVEKVRNSK